MSKIERISACRSSLVAQLKSRSVNSKTAVRIERSFTDASMEFLMDLGLEVAAVCA